MDIPASKEETPVDLMKVRGAFAVTGQALMIASGLRRGENLIAWSAAAGLAANSINLHYGVQKKEDSQRLEETKHTLEEIAGIHGLQQKEASRTILERADRLMQQHSVRIADGIKLGSKYLFRLSGIQTSHQSDMWHGTLSMASKVMTLTGKDEDPYTPQAQKSMLDTLREKSNMFSGGTELVAQLPLFPGAINRYNARLGCIEHDWLQLGGASLFTIGLLAKSFSPFTITRINRDTLYDYAAELLNKLPAEKQQECLPQMAECLHEVFEKEVEMRKLPKGAHISNGEIKSLLEQRLHVVTPDTQVSEVVYAKTNRLAPAPMMRGAA